MKKMESNQDPSLPSSQSSRVAGDGSFDRNGAKEALWASAGLLVLLGGGKTLAPLFSFGTDALYFLQAAYQLYLPLWLIQRRGENPESHSIHLHGALLGPIAALRAKVILRMRSTKRTGLPVVIRRALRYYGRGAKWNGKNLFRDLRRAILIAGVTFPPFVIGHHIVRSYYLGPEHVSYSFAIPPGILEIVAVNMLLVGLPEELFYRGFVQTRLERIWPSRRTIFGIPVDRTVFVVSALFALGHFLGEWNPARLGPFFPAFLFSLLTRKSGSIAGAIFYHGLANVFSATLLYGYQQ
jgi:membrane protease YdiL (CAAX protease family)